MFDLRPFQTGAVRSIQLREQVTHWEPCEKRTEKFVKSWITRPNIGRLRWNLTVWYTIVCRRPRSCENPLPVKSKMADGSQVFNLYITFTQSRSVRFRYNLVSLQSLITWQHIHYTCSRSKGQRSRSHSKYPQSPMYLYSSVKLGILKQSTFSAPDWISLIRSRTRGGVAVWRI